MQSVVGQFSTANVTVRQETKQRTGQSNDKSGTILQFLKWSLKNLPYSVTIGLGLLAVGSPGASGSPLPGRTTLGARNTSVAINCTSGPTKKNTTPDSITEAPATGIDDLFITSAIDDGFQIDISPDQKTTPWLEAVSDWVTETITSETKRSTDSHQPQTGKGQSIRLVSNCKLPDTFMQGFKDGRVEVFVNGTWGTICRDYFTNKSARVVCRMAGLSTDNAAVLPSGTCDRGSGPILLDNVRCLGSENDIMECKNFIPGGVPDCTHDDDVAVRCSNPVRFLLDHERTAVHRGTPQVWYNDTWANISARGMGSAEASILCHDMGFPREDAAVITSGNNHCPTATASMIQGINCTGNETSILDCNRQEWVSSLSSNAPCPITVNCKSNVHLTLAKRKYSKYTRDDEPGTIIGRVEVFENDLWKTVRSVGFGAAEARVICRELGYPLDQGGTKSLHSINFYFDYTFDPVIYSQPQLLVSCSGNETSLMDCSYRADRTYRRPGWYEDTNAYNNDDIAIVRCNSRSRFSSDHPTVVSGYVSGNVKLWRNGIWGGVCNGTINDVTAGVICREIGYPADGAKVLSESAYVTGNKSTVAGNVTCSGDEKSIVDCNWGQEPKGSGTNSQCTQAVVSCVNRIRLAPGACQSQGIIWGKLQMWYDGGWEPVCYSHFYGVRSHAGKIACSEMGYGGLPSIFPRQCLTAERERAHWLLHCTRGESRLKDCIWSDFSEPFDCGNNVELYCLLPGDQGDQRSISTQTISSTPTAPATTATAPATTATAPTTTAIAPATSKTLTPRNTEKFLKTDNNKIANFSWIPAGLALSGLIAASAYVICRMRNAGKLKRVNNDLSNRQAIYMPPLNK